MSNEKPTGWHPKYQGAKVFKGLYLQYHDDGETISVIAHILTPRDNGDKMLWWYGEITSAEVQAIADGDWQDEGDARDAFESFAQHGAYDTKGGAIYAALVHDPERI